MSGLVGAGPQDAHAADEHCHFGCSQRQQLRPIDEQRFRRDGVSALEVIAKSVGDRLEHVERVHVGLFLRGVHASGREWN
jgi:hypothetical protein